jgi:hypothetical protein
VNSNVPLVAREDALQQMLNLAEHTIKLVLSQAEKLCEEWV